MGPVLVMPATVSATGTLIEGESTVADIADTSVLAGAVAVSGAGVPRDTYVESIDSTTQITLTKDATADGSNVTLTFTLEPVAVSEARLHLRQADTAEDPLIARLIAAARRMCERESRRTFLHSTWDYTLDEWPGWADWRFGRWGDDLARIRIPNPPLVSVSSVSYVDDAGTTTPLSSSLYLATAGTPGLITPAYGTAWPSGRYQPGAVAIRYVAGYGPTAESVPEDARVAILMMLANLYDNRGDVDAPMPGVVRELLAGVSWGGYC